MFLGGGNDGEIDDPLCRREMAYEILMDMEYSKRDVTLLFGAPSSGKSAFLTTDLLPILHEDFIGYRSIGPTSKMGKSKVSVATSSPLLQLAKNIVSFCNKRYEFLSVSGRWVSIDLSESISNLLGCSLDVQSTYDRLRRIPDLLGNILSVLGQQLPFTPIIILDQCEQVLERARESTSDFFNALATALKQDRFGNFHVILAIRDNKRLEFLNRLGHEISQYSLEI